MVGNGEEELSGFQDRVEGHWQMKGKTPLAGTCFCFGNSRNQQWQNPQVAVASARKCEIRYSPVPSSRKSLRGRECRRSRRSRQIQMEEKN